MLAFRQNGAARQFAADQFDTLGQFIGLADSLILSFLTRLYRHGSNTTFNFNVIPERLDLDKRSVANGCKNAISSGFIAAAGVRNQIKSCKTSAA